MKLRIVVLTQYSQNFINYTINFNLIFAVKPKSEFPEDAPVRLDVGKHMGSYICWWCNAFMQEDDSPEIPVL